MQYIARQPILDVKQRTQAYELFFRQTAENRFLPGVNSELACRKCIDTLVLIGLDTLTEGRCVYLNCTHGLLAGGYLDLFSPAVTVVEILEAVEPDQAILACCRRLKADGYRIALDDFVDDEQHAPLIELADVIKVDFRATPLDGCARLAQKYGNGGRQMLAEKVETREEFTTALRLGYQLFQGYFFCKPRMLHTPDVAGRDSTHLHVLQVLSKPELDLPEVEKFIKSDPALCYRLLRYLNSPFFYLHAEVRSVLHALALLGEANVRKWLLLACAVEAANREPELMNAALIRARFAELLGPAAKLSSSALFLVGLLSLMDAILEVPLELILKKVALPADVRGALLDEPNPLRQCHELVLAYEAGDWAASEEWRRKLHIPEAAPQAAYLGAVKWARELIAL